MTTVQILLDSVEKVTDFSKRIAKLDYDFDLIDGKLSIDAKSIAGIMSMDLNSPVKLVIHPEEEEAVAECLEALSPYITEAPGSGKEAEKKTEKEAEIESERKAEKEAEKE